MEITLKAVRRQDWDFILELRNTFYTFFYKQTKPIHKNEHYEYMKNQKLNPLFHHWIIMYKRKKVGYVRILDNDVGIMIKQEYQNKGIASKALSKLEEKARKLGIKKLIALVKVGNESSQKSFLKNNYSLKMYLFEKDLNDN